LFDRHSEGGNRKKGLEGRHRSVTESPPIHPRGEKKEICRTLDPTLPHGRKTRVYIHTV